MKKMLILIPILIILLLTACAGPRHASQEALLRSELAKWESFDSQGVVEISYMGLALRKMFSASKNRGELRIDIYDGGIMGASAAPMLSFYSGEYLAFQSPFLPMLEALDLSSMIPRKGLNLFSSSDELFSRYGEQILKEQYLEVDSVQITFNKKYQLVQVFDPKTASRLEATYTTNGKLQDLNLTGTDNLSLNMAFDEISYTQPKIIPLPKAANSGLLNGLIQLENMDLKQLLKSFFGKQ